MQYCNGYYRVIYMVAEELSLVLIKRREFSGINKSNSREVAPLIQHRLIHIVDS